MVAAAFVDVVVIVADSVLVVFSVVIACIVATDV